MSADIAVLACKVRGFCTANPSDIGVFKRGILADFKNGLIQLVLSTKKRPLANFREMSMFHFSKTSLQIQRRCNVRGFCRQNPRILQCPPNLQQHTLSEEKSTSFQQPFNKMAQTVGLYLFDSYHIYKVAALCMTRCNETAFISFLELIPLSLFECK